MGKRSRRFEDERFVRCNVCSENLAIDFFLDIGDLVYCKKCDSEYVLKNRNPIMLSLFGHSFDDYGDGMFDEEYLSNSYD